MARESRLRRRLVKTLAVFDAMPVENAVYRGSPDVAYIGGWIECKQLVRWPARGGVVSMRHFTPHQRAWIMRHVQRGGVAHVLLQVGREIHIFNGPDAARHLGFVARDELLKHVMLSLPSYKDEQVVEFFRSVKLCPSATL